MSSPEHFEQYKVASAELESALKRVSSECTKVSV